MLHHHSFLEDARDGGMSVFFPGIISWSGSPMKSPEVDTATFLGKISDTPQVLREDKPLTLPCLCHCGAIRFRLAPPPTNATALPSTFRAGAYSDLLVPHVASGSRKENLDNEHWFLRYTPRADGGITTKYLAGLCACCSCRKASGNIFQAWAFVPRHLILTSSGDNVLDLDSLRARDKGGEGLKTYTSSPGVYRDFCSRCGATVFWRSDERADVVDVSVGLMYAGEYVRHEEWLEWWMERVSFEEEAKSEPILRLLKEGMRVWKEKRSVAAELVDTADTQRKG